MVDVLVDLPESLFCDVMCNWVDIEHVFKVDTAYCHHKKRDALHNMFRCEQMIVSNRSHSKFGDDLSKNLIEWCTVRELKFFELFLTADMAARTKANQVQSFVAYSGRTLKAFECRSDTCPAVWVDALSVYSTQLCTLDLFTCFESINGTNLGTLLANNQNTLTRLELRLNRIISPVPCSFVLPVLEELVLDVKHDVRGGLNVNYLLQAASKIKRLVLYANTTDVSVLSTLRKSAQATQVETICIYSLDTASAAILPGVCPAGPSLELHFKDEVDPQSFNHCIVGCQNVTLLDCTINHNLSAIAVCGPMLKKLSFRRSDLPGFDPLTLVETVRRCTQLTDFSMCNTALSLNCYDVEDIVRVLAPTVSSLTLCNMCIENCVLQAIGESMPQLTDLRISFGEDAIERYTEEGILYILKGCPKLRSFGVGCAPEALISPMALYLWQKMSPELHLYDGSEDYYEGFDEEYGLNELF